jgi:hypothetical protein
MTSFQKKKIVAGTTTLYITGFHLRGGRQVSAVTEENIASV